MTDAIFCPVWIWVNEIVNNSKSIFIYHNYDSESPDFRPPWGNGGGGTLGIAGSFDE